MPPRLSTDHVTSTFGCPIFTTASSSLRWASRASATLLLSLATARAQPHRSIPPKYISQALALPLAQRGISGEITLLSPVFSSEDEPTFHIHSIEPFGSARLRVQVHCKSNSTCLPFYVLIPCNELGCSASKASATSQHKSPAIPNALRAGAHATLVFDDTLTHIQLSVIALEPGPLGKRIRVASPDHKHTWLAEIITPTLLRGTL